MVVRPLHVDAWPNAIAGSSAVNPIAARTCPTPALNAFRFISVTSPRSMSARASLAPPVQDLLRRLRPPSDWCPLSSKKCWKACGGVKEAHGQSSTQELLSFGGTGDAQAAERARA